MIYEDIRARIQDLDSDLKYSYHPNFQIFKKDVLDYAFKRLRINVVAELGCVWNVDCAYGLYILEKYKPRRIFMVDTDWTDSAMQTCSAHKEITIIDDNFGKSELPEKIGFVDTVILFDVLLHQVAPDWNRVLQMYAPFTKSFLIVEPIFIGAPISIRLLDLGKEGYFRNVPHDPSRPLYKALFEKMYEIYPEHNRIWRDIHNVWQWGITQRDLVQTLDNIGFELDYLNNAGQYGDLTNFVYKSFMFIKRNEMLKKRVDLK